MSQLPILRMWWHEIWLYFLAAFLIALRIPRRMYTILPQETEPLWLEGLKIAGLTGCTILAFSFLVNGSYNPFLYFQF